MSYLTIGILILILAIAFSLGFFVLGLGGIEQNRKAQGLDKETR